jgi:3-deoxy-7-phosphoheptulonate synthase
MTSSAVGACSLLPFRLSAIVEREKAVSSRESHGHQELSRVNKVITALFAPKKVRGEFMVVVMQAEVSEEQIQNVIDHLVSLGFDIHRSTGVSQTVLGAVGVRPDFDPRDIELLPGVREVVRITQPYKLASRAFRPEGTIVKLPRGVCIGGPEVMVVAGPCAVESAEQIELIAARVAQAGARLLRGGAFKPRSSPYSFQGLGEKGLRLLRAAGDRHNLVVVSEVMDPSQIDLMLPYVDVLQVGARNMQNYHLLRALGAVAKPVLLKRGMSATIEEWLLSTEYIMSGGNYNVILCERGIRTFDTYTRNTLDIAAIPAIKKLSHLPILADPSHGTGRRDKVAPMARAAVAAGADGLLLEVHNDPEHALSDGAQSLYFEQFEQLMAELRMIAPAVGRSIAA